MHLTGLLISAVLATLLCESAAQPSGSLRTALHHGRQSQHAAREDDLPTSRHADEHAPEQHLEDVVRHKHALAAAAQAGDDSDDTVDTSDGSDPADELESSSAAFFRDAEAARVGQPPVVVPAPTPAADNVTSTIAPVASTTVSTVTGLPGQLPGNDGEVIAAPAPAPEAANGTMTEPGANPESVSEDPASNDGEVIAAPAPAPEAANGTMTEPGANPESVSEDPAGNATGVVSNSTTGENSSTAVVEDRGNESGDAAQAHGDDVAAEGGAESSTATVSAGDGQGSGLTGLVVGVVLILALIAVALGLSTQL